MLVLGDAHADDPDNDAALREAYADADADVALQVGDLRRYDLPVETWFVAGNTEDFDVIEALRNGTRSPGVRNANLLASTATELEGLRVAGLSSNYAPTKYDLPRDELEGERRRHFVREDVERLAALEDVDVLLTHEAPTGLLSYGYDRVDDLLSALEPALCLVGHHHRRATAEIEGCRVASLAPVWEGYYALDPGEVTLEFHERP